MEDKTPTVPQLPILPDVPKVERPRSYDPYDRATPIASDATTVRVDLRKLSEWIQRRKESEASQDAGQLPESPPPMSK